MRSGSLRGLLVQGYLGEGVRLSAPWRRAAWALLLLALLVPIWGARRLPTLDGTLHVYDAWVAHRLAADDPVFESYMEATPFPVPNWLSHALLFVLLPSTGPVVAEKLVASAYVVAFALAARYLAGVVDERRRPWALLALPLVFNETFQYGFLNFYASLSLFMVALGYAWRCREGPLRRTWGLNGILLLTYFTHPLSLALALVGIAVLWAAAMPRLGLRSQLVRLLCLAPQLVLPLCYAVWQGPAVSPREHASGELMRSFFGLDFLFSFDVPPALGVLIVASYVLAIAITLAAALARRRAGARWWSEDWAFVVIALLMLAAYVFAPDGMFGGWLVRPRFALYPWLAILPWLEAPRRWQPLRVAALAAALIAFGWRVRAQLDWHRSLQPTLDAFTEGLAPIPDGARALVVAWKYDSWERLALVHASSRAAAEIGFFDWEDFHARMGYFPVRYRRGAIPEEVAHVLAGKPVQHWRQFRRHVDYLYLWEISPEVIGPKLGLHYRLVAEGRGALYQRRGAPPDRPRRRRAGATAAPGGEDPAVEAPPRVRPGAAGKRPAGPRRRGEGRGGGPLAPRGK